MNSSALETYLLGVDNSAAPLVIALDKMVRDANPKFDVAIKYKILMYAVHGDFRTWVCAYVAEAVARYDEYRANTVKLLEASRAAARTGRKPR